MEMRTSPGVASSQALGHLILLRMSGDVSTKTGGTLERFSRTLADNMEDALSRHGITYRMESGRFRFTIEVDTPAALLVLQRVFGVQSLSLVDSRPWETLEDVVRGAEQYFQERVRGKRFAVRARRSGRTDRIPFRSPDVERALGRALLEHAAAVDLSTPEVTAYVDVRPGTLYVYDDKVPARGGLPVGVEGRALALVSGGFDSGVAAWLMLKRGVALDYFFCNLGGALHREGVHRVVKVLAEKWSYGTRPQLFEIDFAPVVQELERRAAPKYWQILLKRLMLRAAETHARAVGALGLVTGEAMGQVSSQTLPNLGVISKGLDLPVFRPVIGYNKDEIVRLSRDIGSFDSSVGVDEYCAMASRFPATHSESKRIETEEAKLDGSLLEALLDSVNGVDILSTRPGEAGEHLGLQTIPEGAVMIDLRSRSAYDAWHAPEALHLEFFDALRSYESFGRDRTFVLYCEVGQKSAHVAELMRQAGFRAYHVQGGLRTLQKPLHEDELVIP